MTKVKLANQSPTLHLHAKRLRRDETDAERKLWLRLRDRQVNDLKFRRQQPIGRYIVDFFCPEHRVVVELDGGHHADQVQADQRRTDFLNKAGYRVLRFWDNEVLTDAEAVLERIVEALNTPHPNPLPQGTRVKKRVFADLPSHSRGEGGKKQRRSSPLTPTLSLKGRGSNGGRR